MKSGLCDAHLHLQEPELVGHLDGIFESWKRLGVVHAVCNGIHEPDWGGVAEAALADGRVLPAFGLHPWYVRGRTADWLARLEERLRVGRAVVGEIGIDHTVEGRDDADQEAVFLDQLALAGRLNLPATIHCVSAWGRLDQLLREHRSSLPRCGFLLHAYGGSAEMVPGFAALGARFSFSARAGFPGAVRMRRALEAVPADRLLIETDAPVLPPPPEWTEEEWVDEKSGQRINHPANIVSGYRFVAGFLDIPLDRLIDQVRRNFEALFGV